MILNRAISALILSLVFQEVTFTGSTFSQEDGFGFNMLKKFSDLIAAPFHKIYPGTLWCGAGSIARSYEDLGLFRNVDKCCREHDNCPLFLDPGQGTPEIYNDGAFSRLHCDCELKFYNCLKGVSTIISFKIGKKYFNLLTPTCFTFDYPVKRCLKYNGIFLKRCVMYEVDTLAPPTWQWRDNRLY